MYIGCRSGGSIAVPRTIFGSIRIDFDGDIVFLIGVGCNKDGIGSISSGYRYARLACDCQIANRKPRHIFREEDHQSKRVLLFTGRQSMNRDRWDDGVNVYIGCRSGGSIAVPRTIFDSIGIDFDSDIAFLIGVGCNSDGVGGRSLSPRFQCCGRLTRERQVGRHRKACHILGEGDRQVKSSLLLGSRHASNSDRRYYLIYGYHFCI